MSWRLGALVCGRRQLGTARALGACQRRHALPLADPSPPDSSVLSSSTSPRPCSRRRPARAGGECGRGQPHGGGAPHMWRWLLSWQDAACSTGAAPLCPSQCHTALTHFALAVPPAGRLSALPPCALRPPAAHRRWRGAEVLRHAAPAAAGTAGVPGGGGALCCRRRRPLALLIAVLPPFAPPRPSAFAPSLLFPGARAPRSRLPEFDCTPHHSALPPCNTRDTRTPHRSHSWDALGKGRVLTVFGGAGGHGMEAQ